MNKQLKNELKEILSDDLIDISIIIASHSDNYDAQIRAININGNEAEIEIFSEHVADIIDKDELADINSAFKGAIKLPRIIEVDKFKLSKSINDILVHIGADLFPADEVGFNGHFYCISNLRSAATDPVNYFDEGEFSAETLELFGILYESIKKYDYMLLK